MSLNEKLIIGGFAILSFSTLGLWQRTREHRGAISVHQEAIELLADNQVDTVSALRESANVHTIHESRIKSLENLKKKSL